jgi:GT2 family glycosyltransferase/SAM-dependent methyltransferase
MPRVVPPGALRPHETGALHARDSAGVDYGWLHRHLVAADLGAGGRVLVLGCGDGEGAAIIAGAAAEVVALDADPLAAGRARRGRRAANLTFREWPRDGLNGLSEGGFDLAVCFDLVLDAAAERLLDGVTRLLGESGVLLLSTDAGRDSTPEPEANGHGADAGAPHGLATDRLQNLLHGRFEHVAMWEQRVSAGSRWTPLIPPAAAAAPSTLTVSRQGGGWVRRPAPDARAALVAAASPAPLPRLPGEAELRDRGLAVLERLRTERDEALARVVQAAQAQETMVGRLRAEVVDAQARGLRAAGELRQQIADLNRELDAERRRAELYESRYHVVIGSRGWRALQAVREAPERLHRLRHPRGDEAVLAPVDAPTPVDGRPADGAPASPAAADATLPADRPLPSFRRTDDPVASIIIPVFNNLGHTLHCLEALAANTPTRLIEVIVVDDASTDGTPGVLRRIEGIELLTGETNVGFTGAAGRGAAAARGRVVVFLNNDTEVQPGWLEAMLDAIDSAPDVGAVGCKLVFADGRLQEAGGIIWQDGTGANIGRGGDPEAPRHNVRREVDYCSGAALMVRRDLYEGLGGFDPRFAPAYYEDTDLCFALRDNGFRILYEPRATVVHHEGATHGTDGGVGLAPHIKANQYVNRHVFTDKWAQTLQRHLPAGTAGGLLGGRVDRAPRVLVCDAWLPRHDRDAGGLRMTWIVRLLRRLGCEVTLVALDGQRREPYAEEFQRQGIEVHHGGETYGDLVRQRQRLYDLVILSRPDVARACLEDTRRHLPTATVVYDAVDLEFVREGRRLELAGETPSDDFHRARRRELDVIRACDLVSAVTDAEASVILECVPSARTVLLPTVHALDTMPAVGFAERADLVFLGGYDHAPNVDCARHLAAEVMPLVRRELDARLWLVGSNPPPAVTALHGPDTVVTGYVPDVEAQLRTARVFVAPLRYGAGMKGKNGHAMSHGLPIVTSSVGAEGMGLEDGRHALIRDDPEGFAAAVVELYTVQPLWERISANALELVRRRWTPEAMQQRLFDLLHRTVWVKEPEALSASSATWTIPPG